MQSIPLLAFLTFQFSAWPLLAEQKVIPDVVYGHKAGMALTFDVLEPERDPNGCGLLFMVSGGWVSKWYPPEQMKQNPGISQLLKKGYKLFLVRHGSSPRFKVPEAVEDVRRAVRYIRHHAETYGVDPERLGVFGGSAGGHLSLMLGTTADEGSGEAEDPVLQQSNRVAAVVAYFPPVELAPYMKNKEMKKNFPALDFDFGQAESVSPLAHVTPDDAPTLLVHGEKDKLVVPGHSRRIHRAFKKHEVESRLLLFPDADHGFGGRNQKKATAALVAWFDRHLLGKKSGNKKAEIPGGGPKKSIVKKSGLSSANLIGNWDLKVSMGGAAVDYGLEIERTGNGLAGRLISPRSGEIPAERVLIDEDRFKMRVIRSVQNTDFTFEYEATLYSDGKLAGTVKTGDSTGTMTASKTR
ncbi:MAG: alpha/beta hydrolase [Verrucomicrobiota bacterium]